MVMKKIGRKEIKMINEVVTQGNQDQIQVLFNEIFKACRKEFTADNMPTLTDFAHEYFLNSFSEWLLQIEFDYTLDFDNLEHLLNDTVGRYVSDLRTKKKKQDILLRKVKQHFYKNNKKIYKNVYKDIEN